MSYKPAVYKYPVFKTGVFKTWGVFAAAQRLKVTKQLNYLKKYCDFEVRNDDEMREFVATDQDVDFEIAGKVVFSGVLSDPVYHDDKIVCTCYDKVLYAMKKKLFTNKYSAVAANTILAAICAAGGVSAGSCPTTALSVKFRNATCEHAAITIARMCNKDCWTTDGTTFNIGDKGSNKGVIAVKIGKHKTSRSKKRDKVIYEGYDYDGQLISATAGTGDDAIRFLSRTARDVATLQNLADKKLAELNTEDQSIPAIIEIMEWIDKDLEDGDTITVSDLQKNLSGDYRIIKSIVTSEKVTVDLLKAELATEDRLQDEEIFSEELGVYPVDALECGSGTAFPSDPKEGDLFVRTDENILYRYNGTSWERVVQIANSGTSFPGSPQIGDIYFRTDENILYRWTGAAWEIIQVLSTHGTSFPGSPRVGDFFFKTDDGYLYRWDGSNWIKVMHQAYGSSFPGSPETGDTFYHTSYEQTFYYTGTQWIPLATICRSGTSFPTDKVAGDVFYRTDEKRFYRYDGSTWVYLATPKFRIIWEGESGDISKPSGTTVVADSAASHGQAIRRLSGAASGTMWYGPYEHMGAGDFYAIFCLKVTSNASSTNFLTIDVNSVIGGGVLVGFTLKPSDFPASGQYHIFALRVRLQENWTDVELRGVTFVSGITDAFMDYVGIISAAAPLAETGITVLTKDPGSAADTTDPGTTAAGGYMPWTQILNTGLGSEVNVGTAKVEIRNGTCSSTSNPINLALVRITIQRGTSGGDANVKITVDDANGVGSFLHEFFISIDADLPDWEYWFLVPVSLSGATIHLYGEADSGSVYLKGGIRVLQFKEHTHAITGDSHPHTVSGDSHDHQKTDPKHTH